MKVAILIAGLVRSYDKTFKNTFDKLINPNQKSYDIDVYIAFWEASHQRGDFNNLNIQELTEETKKSVVNSYNPKSFVIMENYVDKNEYFKKKSEDLEKKIGRLPYHPNPWLLYQNGIIAQSYTWNMVFSLIKEKYDIIFKSRFDVYFKDKINFDELNMDKLNCFNKVKQYHPFGDICLAGNPNIMKKIMVNYHHDMMSCNLPNFSPTSRLWPEDILQDYIFAHNIDTKMFNHLTDLI